MIMGFWHLTFLQVACRERGHEESSNLPSPVKDDDEIIFRSTSSILLLSYWIQGVVASFY